jgi:hypothetical protein
VVRDASVTTPGCSLASNPSKRLARFLNADGGPLGPVLFSPDSVGVLGMIAKHHSTPYQTPVRCTKRLAICNISALKN